MNSDVADDGPAECEWCSNPAVDYITRWTALRPGQPPRRVYIYLCPPCITEAQQEQEWSTAQ